MRCADVAGMSETGIANELNDQFVLNMKRISTLRNGKRLPTNI